MARAKAVCTCEKCGKTFYVTAVKSNLKERYSWEEWAQGYYRVCPECTAIKMAEENEEFAQQAEKYGLPPLEGSIKQVHWAYPIRTKMISEIDAYMDSVNARIEKRAISLTAENLAALAEYQAAADATRKIKYAGFWIDNRYYSAPQLLTAQVKYYRDRAKRKGEE